MASSHIRIAIKSLDVAYEGAEGLLSLSFTMLVSVHL